MTLNQPPKGPNEMHPIQGQADLYDNVKDFRPKAPAQTAFQKEMQNTAFREEQRAVDDAKSDAEKLWGNEDTEPRTAFELEMRGGRRPLPAPESAKPSPSGQLELKEPTSPQQSPVSVAPAGKVNNETKVPTVPQPPSSPSPKSGPSAPSAKT